MPKQPLFTDDELLIMQMTGQLPLMLTTRQTAAVIGVKPYDIKSFVKVGGLIPLGVSLAQADGYFDRDSVLALKKADLAKARRAMKEFWAKQNGYGSDE